MILAYGLALIVSLIPAVMIGDSLGNRFADWLGRKLHK